MLALATLTTTTFAAPVAVDETIVNLTSTTGVVPGMRLFANRELLAVDRLLGIGTLVAVRRGQEGTPAGAHSILETVYVGRGDQFFAENPRDVPGMVYANPHINILTGDVWVTQGDDVGPMVAARTWQKVTSAQVIGALGVRATTTTTPT